MSRKWLFRGSILSGSPRSLWVGTGIKPIQKEIVGQFSRLLTRTYSNAIASLRDLDVEIKGTRVLTVNADVVVRTQMVGRPQPVAIDYSLANGAGGWRVYDVSVEGISLVSAYRDEFTGLVSSSGILGLINALRRKNGG